MALSLEERADQHNIDLLVEHTEKILASELTGWVQEMHDALAELRTQQAGKASDKDAAQTHLSNEQTANALDVNRSDVQPMTAQLREGIVKKNQP